jgi:hypothetical protein
MISGMSTGNAPNERARRLSPGTKRGQASVFAALLLAAAASGLLLHRAAPFRTEPVWRAHSGWRYRDDTTIAIARYVAWSQGPLVNDPRPNDLEALESVWYPLLKRLTQHDRIEPRQFWRTVPLRPFTRTRQPYEVPVFEDPGRAIVLAAGFVLLGGISPYLLLWLGPLLAVPALGWMALELGLARRPLAAGVFAFACASSPYIIESLSLPHSAIAFYLLALVGLQALAVYALLGTGRSVPGFWARFALASGVFAVCTICRGGTLAFLPAFLLVMLVAARRVFGGEQWRSPPRLAVAAVILSGAFVAPYVALRPSQQHNVWLGVWEGLGDFATERGYSWYDTGANAFLRANGIEPFSDPRHVLSLHEEFFRRVVLADIRKDPRWYLGVLARRVVATVGLTHLSPWGPRDGASLEQPRFHYKYTTPADWVYVGEDYLELPVSCLWGALAVVALGAALALALRRRWPALGPAASRLGAEAGVLSVGTLAVLPVPVLISTASGLETEAFVLVCFAAVAFLLDGGLAAALSLRSRRRERGPF